MTLSKWLQLLSWWPVWPTLTLTVPKGPGAAWKGPHLPLQQQKLTNNDDVRAGCWPHARNRNRRPSSYCSRPPKTDGDRSRTSPSSFLLQPTAVTVSALLLLV